MPKPGGGDNEEGGDQPMFMADDTHLVERIARLAVFHDLPTPVVVQMMLMVSELQRRPAADVHREMKQRIAQMRAGDDRLPRPTLTLVSANPKR